MTGFSQKYVSSIRKIARLTLTSCANCFLPYSCCDPMYGKIVEDCFPAESKHFEKGDNKKCQYLLPGGCSVPPEYRPLCSLHTCERNLFEKSEFRNRWFKLNRIIQYELIKMEK